MDPSGEKFEVRSFEQDKGFLDKVSKAVDSSYKEVAGNLGMDPDEIYFSRRCEQVNQVFKNELDKEGFESEVAKYVGWDVTNHEMLVFHYGGKEIIIDPTWQQFLEKPNPSLPRILIAPREEISGKLAELGVPPDKHHIWKEAKTSFTETPFE